jgi:hypothetical protein
MWRSLEPFKQDIEVHELSKDNIEAVGKFGGGGGLQKFKHKELLVDCAMCCRGRKSCRSGAIAMTVGFMRTAGSCRVAREGRGDPGPVTQGG